MDYGYRVYRFVTALLLIVAPCNASLHQHLSLPQPRAYLQMLTTKQRIATGVGVLGGIAIGGYALYRWQTLKKKPMPTAAISADITATIGHSDYPYYVYNYRHSITKDSTKQSEIWNAIEAAYKATIASGCRTSTYIKDHAHANNIPIPTYSVPYFDHVLRFLNILPKPSITFADHLAYFSYVHILPQESENYHIEDFFNVIKSNINKFMAENMNSKQTRWYTTIKMPHKEIRIKLYSYIEHLANSCTHPDHASVRVKNATITHSNTSAAGCSAPATINNTFLESIRISLCSS